MYLKHFSVQQLPQDCESFKLDRIKTMEQSNSLDINIKLELQTIHLVFSHLRHYAKRVLTHGK